MFTYKELSKDSNTATISLDGAYSEDIYVPAQQAKNEDYSNFTI